MQPPSGTPETAMTRQMPPLPVGDANTSSLPPAPTLVSASGDACPNCGATVAADQRYCIECGERRGDPRLPFMDGRSAIEASSAPAQATPYGAYAYAPPIAPNRKWSSGLAMLATLGLLVLAMGVGVLIGNDGGSSNATAQQPVIIGGAGATAATGASDATAASKDSSSKTAAASSSDGDGNTSSGVDAEALAKKNGVKLAPPTVDLGEKCSKGSVGCSDGGEFTGDYFK